MSDTRLPLPEPEWTVAEQRANTVLATLEHYFDTREMFYDSDEEGRSGVYWRDVVAARAEAHKALAALVADR